ncbi:MAG: ParB/RepB/Spo0J family partition protein [Thermoleophilia bacterium]
MNNKNKGLGRGLSALIRENNTDITVSQAGAPAVADLPYQELPLSQISSNPQQPRKAFNGETITELAESIASVGLVQPLIVRRRGDAYELIAGERRWRASQQAGLEKVPVIVRETGDAESLELALIENINREDLNPIDTARAYALLQDDFGVTQEKLAKKLGRSRSAVANTLRLLDLPDEVQDLLETGRLSEGHGRALLSVQDRQQLKRLAKRISERQLSVRQTEALVKKESDSTPAAREPKVIPVSQELMDEATDAIYSAFRLPVKIKWKGDSGKVEMEFLSEEQLLSIINVLDNA